MIDPRRPTEIAQRLTEGLDAVAIGGSVARGTADAYSDLEIGCFWPKPASDEARAELVEARFGVRPWHQSSSGGESTPWSAADSFELDGVSVDLAHRDTPGVDADLERLVERFNPQLRLNQFAHALDTLQPVAGSDLIEGWQVRLRPFPEPLRKAMLETHASFRPRGGIELHRLRRDRFLFRHQLFDYQRRVSVALFALNRRYHPGYKRLEQSLADLPVQPDDLVERLVVTLTDGDLDRVWEVMTELVRDVFALIDAHAPEVDTTPLRAEFARVRRAGVVAVLG